MDWQKGHVDWQIRTRGLLLLLLLKLHPGTDHDGLEGK
jgi:hypothetical protein